MWMPAKTGLANFFACIEKIEKYERLDHLADVGGTHQPDDRPVRVATRAKDDMTANTDIVNGRSLESSIREMFSRYLTCRR